MNVVSKPEAKLAIAISSRRSSAPMANENWKELCFEILAAELGWERVGLTLQRESKMKTPSKWWRNARTWQNRLERCRENALHLASLWWGRAKFQVRKNQYLWAIEELKHPSGTRLGRGKEDAGLENSARTGPWLTRLCRGENIHWATKAKPSSRHPLGPAENN